MRKKPLIFIVVMAIMLLIGCSKSEEYSAEKHTASFDDANMKGKINNNLSNKVENKSDIQETNSQDIKADMPQENQPISKETTEQLVIDVDLEIGDYISFGKYNGQPILWQIVNMNEDNDPLLWSEYIISYKPFDGAESGQSNKAGGVIVIIDTVKKAGVIAG